MTNTTEQLSPSAVAAILERRARMHAESLAGACAELQRVQQERDALRGAIERALEDLRNGWPEAAIDVLARTSGSRCA